MTDAPMLPSRGRQPSSTRARIGRIATVAFACLVLVLVTGWLDGGKGVAPLRIFDQPRFLIANAWPGLLLFGVLLALTRRVGLSAVLALLCEGLVLGVNSLKVAELGTPLMPADFRMVGQLSKGGAHLLGGYLPHGPVPYLALLAGVVLIVVLWRYEPPLFARRTRGKRLATGLVMAILLVSLLGGVQPWGRIYNGHVLWLEPWSATSTATHAGLISSLVMFHLQYGHGKHKPDPAAAKQLIAQIDPALRQRLASKDVTHGERPDIVVIQSESFFDPTVVKGMEHSDFTPNLKRLAKAGVSGPLHVPTFGGGTIRTEFEVLTGLSLRYFNELQFPYLQINNKVVPGLVRALRSHGYATTAIHGNNPTFWNRNIAFKAIGFDRFVSQSSFPPNAPNDGTYMADSAMTDEIMDQLKDAGPPQFLFAISIEAHGPYNTVPRDTAARDAIAVPAGVTGKDKLELQNYLYHIGHADAELGRLAALLAKRERPTLLLFYGDHLPGLSDTYRRQGFVDGKNMLAEAGTWLLVDPRNPGKPETENMASWMLPGKLLDEAGIHDEAYFALTQVLAPQLASLTRAPDAPAQPDDASQRQLDQEMANVALLQMNGKLDKLWQTAQPSTTQDVRYATGSGPSAEAAAGSHQ